jgi:type I restriction enzyme S subunit
MTWGQFQESENKAVPTDRLVDPRFEIRAGDVLVSRANTEQYVGAPVLVGQCRPRLLLSDKSLRLVPRVDVDPRWLVEALSSPGVRRQISAGSTGMKESMRNVSQATLLAVELLIPPPELQVRVAEHLSSVLGHIERLDSEVDVNERRAKLLRSSLLAEAFSGRLVPQSPNDEPASVLLERIRAERAAQPGRRRGRRRRAEAGEQEVLL